MQVRSIVVSLFFTMWFGAAANCQPPNPKDVRDQQQAAIAQFRAAAARELDPCLIAVYTAINDDTVFDLWFDKLVAGYQFVGPTCFEADEATGHGGGHGGHDGDAGGGGHTKAVLFDFNATAGNDRFGAPIVPGDFLVLVHVEGEINSVDDARVMKIINPYATAPDGDQVRGCDASGSAGANIAVNGNEVKLTVSARGKVRCFGQTVFSGSATITATKNLRDLNPCANIEASASRFTVKGKLCHRGSSVCLEDAGLYVSYGGDEYKICSIEEICVGL